MKRDATIVVVPARGGSQRIPRKNLLPLRGRPLVVHTVEQALDASSIDAVVVSTDDAEIARVAREAGAEVVIRPQELATAEASTESALLHVLQDLETRGEPEPELVVLLQCTSPIRRPGDIDAAVATLRTNGADSAFSACRDLGLFWTVCGDHPRPINYDPLERKREQDMAPQFRENGSIFVFKTSALKSSGSRISGRVAIYEMDMVSSFQIDTPEDVELIERVMASQAEGHATHWPDPLELVVFDFDGVITDNGVTVSSDGTETVRCDRRDSLGIASLRKLGIPMLVLSTESNQVVRYRCDKLHLECLHGIDDKGATLRNVLADRGIRPAGVAYVGNDVNDLDCLQLVGLPVAVGDAHPQVLKASKLLLTRPGGCGAVREFCEQVLAHVPGKMNCGGQTAT